MVLEKKEKAIAVIANAIAVYSIHNEQGKSLKTNP